MKRAALLFGLIALAGVAYWLRLQRGVYPSPNWARLEAQARAFCDAHRLPYPLQQPALHIEKDARRVQLLEQGKVIAEFPIALSRASEGHKQREGDRKTPEGDYYVCEKHVSRRFYLFLGLSYPNASDAEAGYRAGRITKEQRQQIESAIRAGQCPPWDTPYCTRAQGGDLTKWQVGLPYRQLSVNACRAFRRRAPHPNDTLAMATTPVGARRRAPLLPALNGEGCQPAQRVGAGIERLQRVYRFLHGLLGVGARLLDAEQRGVGCLFVGAVGACGLAHLLGRRGLVQDVVGDLERQPQRAAVGIQRVAFGIVGARQQRAR